MRRRGQWCGKYECQTLGWQRSKISCQLHSSDRPPLAVTPLPSLFFHVFIFLSLLHSSILLFTFLKNKKRILSLIRYSSSCSIHPHAIHATERHIYLCFWLFHLSYYRCICCSTGNFARYLAARQCHRAVYRSGSDAESLASLWVSTTFAFFETHQFIPIFL